MPTSAKVNSTDAAGARFFKRKRGQKPRTEITLHVLVLVKAVVLLVIVILQAVVLLVNPLAVLVVLVGGVGRHKVCRKIVVLVLGGVEGDAVGEGRKSVVVSTVQRARLWAARANGACSSLLVKRRSGGDALLPQLALHLLFDALALL